MSRKCIAISLIEPLQITGKTRKNRISKIQMNWKKKLVDETSKRILIRLSQRKEKREEKETVAKGRKW